MISWERLSPGAAPTTIRSGKSQPGPPVPPGGTSDRRHNPCRFHKAASQEYTLRCRASPCSSCPAPSRWAPSFSPSLRPPPPAQVRRNTLRPEAFRPQPALHLLVPPPLHRCAGSVYCHPSLQRKSACAAPDLVRSTLCRGDPGSYAGRHRLSGAGGRRGQNLPRRRSPHSPNRLPLLSIRLPFLFGWLDWQTDV